MGNSPSKGDSGSSNNNQNGGAPNNPQEESFFGSVYDNKPDADNPFNPSYLSEKSALFNNKNSDTKNFVDTDNYSSTIEKFNFEADVLAGNDLIEGSENAIKEFHADPAKTCVASHNNIGAVSHETIVGMGTSPTEYMGSNAGDLPNKELHAQYFETIKNDSDSKTNFDVDEEGLIFNKNDQKFEENKK